MLKPFLITTLMLGHQLAFPNGYSVKCDLGKPDLPRDFIKQYIGAIKTNKISMTLHRDNQKLSGTYSYEKSEMEIAVRGTIDESQNIVLDQLDENGNATAEFKGRYISETRIEGTWRRLHSGMPTLPFYLTEKSSQ